MRHAVARLAGDAATRTALGQAARASVERCFRLEQFVERFSSEILQAGRRERDRVRTC
jgi:hypothetical protein